jgi:hypothetical protein
MARLTQETARATVDQFFRGHDDDVHYEVIASDTGASVTVMTTGGGRGAAMNKSLAQATIRELMEHADADIWGVSIDALSLSVGAIDSPKARREINAVPDDSEVIHG